MYYKQKLNLGEIDHSIPKASYDKAFYLMAF